MLFLVHEDTIDPKNSVSILEASPLCWAALLNHPDQVAISVLLNSQEEAIALPFLFIQLTFSGVKGGGHFCDEKQMDKSMGKDLIEVRILSSIPYNFILLITPNPDHLISNIGKLVGLLPGLTNDFQIYFPKDNHFTCISNAYICVGTRHRFFNSNRSKTKFFFVS